MIVSRNYYYARPGAAQAVLEQRLRACAVRQEIGLPRGRVLCKSSGAPDLPDVIWEIEFDGIEDHHADMAARAASPEFEAIRHGMRQLYRRFERPLYAAATAQFTPPETGNSSQHIVFIDIFCDPGSRDALSTALQQQVSAADRLLQLLGAQADIPQFVWTLPGGSAMPQLELPADASARFEHSLWQYAD